MKDKYGLKINIGDLVTVIDACGVFAVHDIHEDRDSVSYATPDGMVYESSSGVEALGFAALCDSSGNILGLQHKQKAS